MKKLFVATVIAIFSVVSINAQGAKFGFTAGYNSTIFSASAAGATGSTSQSGFFAGFFADITVSEKFHVQPELQYVMIFADGGSGNQLVLPIMAKFYAADQFYLQAGPQLDLIVEDSPGVKKLGIGLGFGAGYDFSDAIFATARYSLGLNNRLENTTVNTGSGSVSGVSVNLNFLQIGLGYRF